MCRLGVRGVRRRRIKVVVALVEAKGVNLERTLLQLGKPNQHRKQKAPLKQNLFLLLPHLLLPQLKNPNTQNHPITKNQPNKKIPATATTINPKTPPPHPEKEQATRVGNPRTARRIMILLQDEEGRRKKEATAVVVVGGKLHPLDLLRRLLGLGGLDWLGPRVSSVSGAGRFTSLLLRKTIVVEGFFFFESWCARVWLGE